MQIAIYVNCENASSTHPHTHSDPYLAYFNRDALGIHFELQIRYTHWDLPKPYVSEWKATRKKALSAKAQALLYTTRDGFLKLYRVLNKLIDCICRLVY